MDLAQLASVRTFAAAVGERLGETPIDALVLNAGVSLSSAEERTADGFETTFAVNHLAHYLLLRLLLRRLAPDATVVLTSSGTHDPAARTIVPPPRHAVARLLAHPELDPERDAEPETAGGRAYSSSKLCNLLTARAFAALPEARRFTVIAYDPGPTPGTGLVRTRGRVVRALWWIMGSPLRGLIPRLNSAEAAGDALGALVLHNEPQPPGRIYAALRRGRLTWIDPSELARSDAAMHALWDDSAALLGLSRDASDSEAPPASDST